MEGEGGVDLEGEEKGKLLNRECKGERRKKMKEDGLEE